MRKMLSVLLAVLTITLYPLQTFASQRSTLFQQGKNAYTMQTHKILNEQDMDELIKKLNQPYLHEKTNADYSIDASRSPKAIKRSNYLMDNNTSSAKEIETQRFRIYPVTVQEDGKCIFQGVFVGGNIENQGEFVSLEYSLSEDGIVTTITDIGLYVYPDSSFFGFSQYSGHTDNWQSSVLFETFQNDTLYHFDLKFTADSPLEESDEEETELDDTSSPTDADDPPGIPKIYEETISESFLIYQVKTGDTLPVISQYYGVSLTTLILDNHLESKILHEGDRLFLRAPKRIGGLPLSESLTQEQWDSYSLLGFESSSEYAYDIINLSTGNLLFEQTQTGLQEYTGFSISKSYNSLSCTMWSSWGRGASSLTTIKLTPYGDRWMLFSEDGKVVYFNEHESETGGYYSTNGDWILTFDDSASYITDLQSNRYTFNEYGQIVSYTDKSGLPIVFVYDDNQALTAVKSKSETVFSIEYNATGNIAQLIKPDGTSLKYSYDSDGYMTASTDELNYETTYEYDPQKRLTAVINPLGDHIWRVEHDALGRIAKYIDGNGEASTFEYNASQTRFTDARNIDTIYTIDGKKRITEISYPDGSTESKQYNEYNLLTAFTDKDGLLTQYRYDEHTRNLITEILPDEKTIQYQYNFSGDLIGEIDALGRTTRYEYDSQHNNTKITYPDDTAQLFSYDILNRLSSVTNPKGETITYEYTGKTTGVVKVTDSAGVSTVNSYDAMGRLLSSTTGDETTQYTYLSNGLLDSMKNPDGTIEKYEYDAAGKSVGVVDPKGNRTGFVYDKEGRIIQIVAPDNGVIQYSYDANGNLKSETNAKGETYTYDYDESNQAISQTNPDGISSSFVYDKKGRVIKETDADGFTITYEYHPTLDKITLEKDKLNRITRYTYDDSGNLLTKVLPDETTLTYTYDSRDRKLTETNEKGITLTYTYDSNGNTTSITDHLGQSTVYTYDNKDNVISETDSLGNVKTYTYNSKNWLTKVTDSLGNTSTYSYDSMGQRTEETDRNGNTIKSAYDNNGNLIRYTDANENVTTYTYDSQNRVTKETRSDGAIYAQVYDEAGNVTNQIDPYGNVTAYEYNHEGKITKETAPDGGITSYTYDSDGNVTEITYPDGTKNRYTYNKLGWRKSATGPGGHVINYEHDIMGRIVRVYDSNGREERNTYDEYGNLVQTVNSVGQTAKNSYDAYGRILSKTDFNGQTTSYNYDALGRKVTETDSQGRVAAFFYDAVGNNTKIVRHDGKEKVMEYDSNTNMTSLTDELGDTVRYAYDANGNIISITTPDGKTVAMTYNSNNQIVSETDKRGNTETYTYDAMGRKLTETTPKGIVERYEYDVMGRLASSMDGAGNVTSYRYNTMGQKTEVTNPAAGITKYAYNNLGKVSQMTLHDGSTVHYEYDKYGNNTLITYPNQTTERFAYDALNRITRHIDIAGVQTDTEYDQYGNIILTKDSVGKEYRYNYDQHNRLLEETLDYGGKATYTYDSFDRVILQTVNDEAVTRYCYDLAGRTTEVISPLGRTTNYEYDSNGNTVRIDDAGRVFTFSYDANGNLTSQTDPLGKTKTWEYDTDNNVIRESDHKGSFTVYTYNEHGQLSAAADRMGQQTQYQYDSLNNVKTVTTADGAARQYLYDEMGRLVQVLEPDGKLASYSYDSMGNMVKSVLALDTMMSGQVLRPTQVSVYEYTPQGKLARLKDGKDTVHERMTYDVSGNRTSTIYPSGKAIAYEYDTYNSLISTSYRMQEISGESLPGAPVSPEITNQYDTLGRLTAMTDHLGSTSYSYDAENNLTEVSYSEGMRLDYEYDVFGAVEVIAYPDGSRVSYTRDGMGRVLKMTERDGKQVNYSYDENGNVTTVTRADGSVTNNSYDANDRLVSTENRDAQGNVISGYRYAYDSMNRIIEENVTDQNGETARSYAYNLCGELLRYTENANGTQSSTDYLFDLFGNKSREILKTTGRRDVVTEYIYDEETGLLSAKMSSGKVSAAYFYDEDGNLIKKAEGRETFSYTYTPDNKLAETKVNGRLENSVYYDGNGMKAFELLRKEYSYSEPDQELAHIREDSSTIVQKGGTIANPHTDTPQSAAPEVSGSAQEKDSVRQESRTQTEQADEKTALLYYTLMQIPVGAASAFSPTMAFELYRTMQAIWEDLLASLEQVKDVWYTVFEPGKKTEIPTLEESATQEQEPSLSQSRAKYLTGKSYTEILEVIEGESGTKSYLEPTRYLYDLTEENPQVLAEYGNADAPRTLYSYALQSRVSEQGTRGTESYYLYDGRGSVSEVVTQNTVTASYRYDPYGNLTQGSPGQNRAFTYNGEQYTPQTGLLYLRARHYDPDSGRFTTKDSYLGSLTNLVSRNRYVFGNNNPVMNQDPSGYFSEWLKNAASAVKNAVTSAAKAVVNTVKTVVNKVTSAVKTVASTVVSSVQKIASSVSNTVSKTVSNVKTAVTTTTKSTPAPNKSSTVATANYNTNSSSSSSSSSWGSSSGSSSSSSSSSSSKSTSSVAVKSSTRYNTESSPAVKTDFWGGFKNVMTSGINQFLDVKRTVSEQVQKANQWWDNTSPVKWMKDNIVSPISSAKANIANAWNSSSVGQWVNKTGEKIANWYEENKVAVNIAIGVTVIALCVVATVVTGGAAAGLAGAIAVGALKGALIGAGIGAAVGAISGAVDHVERTGSLDGAGKSIAESASSGFAGGALSGAITGGISGGVQYQAAQQAAQAGGATTATVSEGGSGVVKTPYGDAVQSLGKEANTVKSGIKNGGTVYRGGTLGRSSAAEGQFWAPENPLNPGYADRYGVDFSKIDFIIGGKVKPNSNIITRPAPGLGTNGGGAIEMVTDPNNVKLDFFYMP